jgi:hypothetical protein
VRNQEDPKSKGGSKKVRETSYLENQKDAPEGPGASFLAIKGI